MTYMRLSLANKFVRMIWGVVWLCFYRPSPKNLHIWRRFLLRIFGAKIAAGVHPYPTSKVWAPWNLTMESHSCLGEYVDCYNVAHICIGEYSTISQYSYLCSASHDYSRASMPLVVAPINIGKYVWITSDVFVGPNVNIADGCVVTVRSTVLHDLPAWKIAQGNPAEPIKSRRFDYDT